MTDSKKLTQAESCCHSSEGQDISGLGKIVIVGSPNVGKSLVFNKLTGAYADVSNYPGTTVTFFSGKAKINGVDIGVIDSPGMYSLIPITEEERIAKLILLEKKLKIVLHVIDAKNLKRMLPLALQLIEANLPVILAVNMMDEAERLGIKIDFNDLENKLGVPVVPLIATTGKGINKLNEAIDRYSSGKKIQIAYDGRIELAITEIESLLKGSYLLSKRTISLLALQGDKDILSLIKERDSENLSKINGIASKTSKNYSHPLNYVINMRLEKESNRLISSSLKISHSERTGFGEKLSRIMINPVTGIPILIAILYFGIYQFVGVFGAGELVNLIESRIFGEMINPFVTDFVLKNIPYKAIQDLIVGEYGIITLGVTYAVAIILPIVGTFFLAFSVIEDSGYLPRLALLIDRLFKKIGLSGRAVIPMVLGLGCDTMATMVTRTQETNRERIISTLLLALAVPCSAQLGVIFAILAGYPNALLVWAIVILFNFILIGFLASKVIPGEKPSFYMELPPLRFPIISNILTKTYSRLVWYFKEIFPLFILASVFIWVLQLIGVFQLIISALEPVVILLGLPATTAKVFLFGFFRRDYGAAGLYEIQSTLSGAQLTVAAVTLTLFVPCIAQFMMMIKERGMKTALLMFVFIFFFAFGVGFALNQLILALGVSL